MLNPFKKDNPKDTVIEVFITFDMRTNQMKLVSKCPTVMLLGVLENAKSAVIQNQVIQRLAAEAEGAKAAPVEVAAGGAKPS
jgi:hypothetical protein